MFRIFSVDDFSGVGIRGQLIHFMQIYYLVNGINNWFMKNMHPWFMKSKPKKAPNTSEKIVAM